MLCNIVINCAGGSKTALTSFPEKNKRLIQEMQIESDKNEKNIKRKKLLK